MQTDAQAQNRGGCAVGRPPFATTPANQIGGAELKALLPGARLIAMRLDSNRNETRYGFEFRADGSLVFTCHTLSGSTCTNFNPANPSARGRDIGVWRIESDVVVVQRTRFAEAGRQDGRVTLHRQGNVYAGARTVGPHFCLPGLVMLERPQ